MVRRVPPPADAAALYERAVAALAHRGRSRSEMERWLRARGAAPAAIADVLARLADHGYLDDRRFAQSFAGHQKDASGFGAARVRRDLRRRGVAATLADQAVTDAFAGSSEDRLLAEYLRRKRLPRPENQRQTASLYRRLWQAGFGPGAIQAALRRWRLNPEWLEALAAAEWSESELDSTP